MRNRFCRSFGLMVALTFFFGPFVHADGSNSAKAFTRLSSLIGEWTGVESGTQVLVTYKLIANGSVLMENTRPAHGPAGLTMITMFSVDGDHLIATHYCDAKNQPQMATKGITNPGAKSFAFFLVRVTGLRAPSEWHNTAVEILLQDRDHLTQKWTYVSAGKIGTTVFQLTRKGT